jgi:hypothetical protein
MTNALCFAIRNGQKKRRAFALARYRRQLVLIEDLAIVNFDNFAFGIGDQHVAAAHVGPVTIGFRRGQIALLPLFNGVFRRQIKRVRCRRRETAGSLR